MLCPYCLNDVVPNRLSEHDSDEWRYKCPLCTEILPTRYVRDYKTHLPISFSIVGLSGHGKTVYLASLLHELESAGKKWPGFNLGLVDEASFQDLLKRTRSLKDGQLPDATLRVFPRPVIVRLSDVPHFGNGHLLMYDTGGEVFETSSTIIRYAGYVTRSPALIWLISLDDLKSPSQLIEFLRVYLESLQKMGGHPQRQTLLVVLTKGDQLLHHNRMPPVVREYLSEDEEDVDLNETWRRLTILSRELESWLAEQAEYVPFIALAQQSFQTVRYTVVSAIASDPSKHEEFFLKPRGVLGPLIWAMSVSDMAMTPQLLLTGHRDAVTSMAFSPDGQYLLSGSKDGTLRLWNTTEENTVRQYAGLGGWIWSVAFSPNGELVAGGGHEKQVLIWDRHTGAVKQRLTGFRRWIFSVAFSPIGQIIAAGGSDNTIYLWNSASGSLMKSLFGHNDIVESISFAPDGKMLASAGHDGTVRLWNIATGRTVHILRGHHKAILCVSYSPDGYLVVSGDEAGEICVWDAQSGILRHRLKGHHHRVEYLAFPLHGGILASEGPQELRLWDARMGQLLRSRTNHGGGTQCVALAPDGGSLACVWDYRNIRVWKVH